jgi:hypothetical protein
MIITIIKGWHRDGVKGPVILELFFYLLFCMIELTTKIKVNSMAEIATALDSRQNRSNRNKFKCYGIRIPRNCLKPSGVAGQMHITSSFRTNYS